MFASKLPLLAGSVQRTPQRTPANRHHDQGDPRTAMRKPISAYLPQKIAAVEEHGGEVPLVTEPDSSEQAFSSTSPQEQLDLAELVMHPTDTFGQLQEASPHRFKSGLPSSLLQSPCFLNVVTQESNERRSEGVRVQPRHGTLTFQRESEETFETKKRNQALLKAPDAGSQDQACRKLRQTHVLRRLNELGNAGLFSLETINNYPQLFKRHINSRQLSLPIVHSNPTPSKPQRSVLLHRSGEKVERPKTQMRNRKECRNGKYRSHDCERPCLLSSKSKTRIVSAHWPTVQASESHPNLAKQGSGIEIVHVEHTHVSPKSKGTERSFGCVCGHSGRGRQAFRTMDPNDFEFASLKESKSNLSRAQQQSSVQMRHQASSPTFLKCRHLDPYTLRHQKGSIHSKGKLSHTPMTRLQARSQSDARSNSIRETMSRVSVNGPIVMRHCYMNNEEKKKLVEQNQAAWIESHHVLAASVSQKSSKQRRLNSPRSFGSTASKAQLTKNSNRTTQAKTSQAKPSIQVPKLNLNGRHPDDQPDKGKSRNLSKSSRPGLIYKSHDGKVYVRSKLLDKFRIATSPQEVRSPKNASLRGFVSPQSQREPQRSSQSKIGCHLNIQKSSYYQKLSQQVQLRSEHPKTATLSPRSHVEGKSSTAQLTLYARSSHRSTFQKKPPSKPIKISQALPKNNTSAKVQQKLFLSRAQESHHLTVKSQAKTHAKQSVVSMQPAVIGLSSIFQSTVSPVKSTQQNSEIPYDTSSSQRAAYRTSQKQHSGVNQAHAGFSSAVSFKHCSSMAKSTSAKPAPARIKQHKINLKKNKEVIARLADPFISLKPASSAQANSCLVTPSKLQAPSHSNPLSSHAKASQAKKNYSQLPPTSKKSTTLSRGQSQKTLRKLSSVQQFSSDLIDFTQREGRNLDTIESVEGCHFTTPLTSLPTKKNKHYALSYKLPATAESPQCKAPKPIEVMPHGKSRKPGTVSSPLPGHKTKPGKGPHPPAPLASVAAAAADPRKKSNFTMIQNYAEQLQAKERMSLRSSKQPKAVATAYSAQIEAQQSSVAMAAKQPSKCATRASLLSHNGAQCPPVRSERQVREFGVADGEEELGVDTWLELDESEEVDAAKLKLLQFNYRQAREKITTAKRSQKSLSGKKAASPGKLKYGALVDSRETRRQLDQKIRSHLHSVQPSHQGSAINLSIAKTETAAFQPTNPLRILRKMQREQNYVWFAVYDDDTLHANFMRKIGQCEDTRLPWEFVPWRLCDVQLFLQNEHSVCLRREFGKEVLCKIYLVHLDQLKDIVRLKNYENERKQTERHYLVSQGQGLGLDDDVQTIEALRVRYRVHKLGEPAATLSQGDHSLSQQSVADEGAIRNTQEDGENNFVLSLNQAALDSDLLDAENPPVLDLILQDQMALGLPVLFATNRDQGRFDDCVSQTPSFFKHLLSLKPNPFLLSRMLQGLMQSFPDFTAEELMRNYIDQIPGIRGKLTEQEICDILDKALCGASIVSEVPPQNLLSAKQTSKMLEFMSNKQIEPFDVHSGYQSLSLYQEQLEVGDRDVVFLEADSSSAHDQHDLSLNQQQLLEQFNREFQMQQLPFQDGQIAMPPTALGGVYQSDTTSQIENFIFQNNINRFSNDVSQEFDVTPLREQLTDRRRGQAAGTQAVTSRNESYVGPNTNTGHKVESGHTTSYQGACKVINMQQPLFQSNQWNHSALEDSVKDDEHRICKFNRGSSQGVLSSVASPPFRPETAAPVRSARKPTVFSRESSTLMPQDIITSNSSAVYRNPLKNTTHVERYKNFFSHVPSTNRSVSKERQELGRELPLDDFVTNVEPIRPLPREDNTSGCQGSNSLFIQSGHSLRQQAQRLSCQNKNSNQRLVLMAGEDGAFRRQEANDLNRFELSVDEVNDKLSALKDFQEIILDHSSEALAAAADVKALISAAGDFSSDYGPIASANGKEEEDLAVSESKGPEEPLGVGLLNATPKGQIGVRPLKTASPEDALPDTPVIELVDDFRDIVQVRPSLAKRDPCKDRPVTKPQMARGKKKKAMPTSSSKALKPLTVVTAPKKTNVPQGTKIVSGSAKRAPKP